MDGVLSRLSLPLFLALRTMRQHLVVSAATAAGVAIGMTVVCAILVVDANTRDSAGASEGPATVQKPEDRAASADTVRLRIRKSPIAPDITGVSFNRGAGSPDSRLNLVPSQSGAGGSDQTAADGGGNEDYAAMRLAVRLASLISFLVGAVIVFYTMRFSVAARAREFCLLLCLGQSRRGVSASLLWEAGLLGALGTVIGLGLAIPAGGALLSLGISTTGQIPLRGLSIPWPELLSMSAISIAIALSGVLGPVRTIFGMEIAQVLQPRFMTDHGFLDRAGLRGFAWLIPPALAGTYILVRPFLLSWLSVVHFFLFEAAFVTILAAATLWWVRPVLRSAIRLFEVGLKPFLPLETLLAGRRMRLGTREFAFAVTGVVLVFSMLTALHDITRALKDEIQQWAGRALVPYLFYEQTSVPFNIHHFRTLTAQNGLIFIRMSEKLPGAIPMRMVHSADLNAVHSRLGLPLIGPGKMIASKTIAARYGLSAGDSIVLHRDGERHPFDIILVTDDVGFYAEDGRYVDQKSYFILSEGNPLFADNLERTLGRYGVARFPDGRVRAVRGDALYPYYLRSWYGIVRGHMQIREIDRDFLIFDFILILTVILAAIGVANTLLIQVFGRSREFSVFRTLGMGRWQVVRLLLAEGMIVGLVGAFLAAIVGNVLGAVSVGFLDHFTLFDYRFRFSWSDTLVISAICIITCLCAAIYPSVVALRSSSAESLHYE